MSAEEYFGQFSLGGRTPILENIYDVIATEFSKIELVLSKEVRVPAAGGGKREGARREGEADSGAGDIVDDIAGDYEELTTGNKRVYMKMEGHPNYSVLALRPNVLQTKSDLLYTVAYQLHSFRNALVRIVRDTAADRNIVTALEPINCEDYYFGQGYAVGDKCYLKLKAKDTGAVVLLDYDDIVHLRLNPNDVFYYDKNDRFDLARFVRVFDDNLNSLLNELRDSGSLKGIVEIGASLGAGSFNGTFIGDTNKIDRAREIVDRIRASDGGIIVMDSGEKWVSLNRTYKTMSTDEVNNYMKYLYNFKGINQAVIDGTANEAQMGVFFNKTIAPIIMRFIEELNYKFLTQTARTQGQRIEYYKNPFEYTSVKDLLRHLYLGAMFFSPNEVRRAAFKMPPLPGGDGLLSNKNFSAYREDEKPDKEDDDEEKD